MSAAACTAKHRTHSTLQSQHGARACRASSGGGTRMGTTATWSHRGLRRGKSVHMHALPVGQQVAHVGTPAQMLVLKSCEKYGCLSGSLMGPQNAGPATRRQPGQHTLASRQRCASVGRLRPCAQVMVCRARARLPHACALHAHAWPCKAARTVLAS